MSTEICSFLTYLLCFKVPSLKYGKVPREGLYKLQRLTGFFQQKERHCGEDAGGLGELEEQAGFRKDDPGWQELWEESSGCSVQTNPREPFVPLPKARRV